MSIESDSNVQNPMGPRRHARHGFFGGLLMGGLLGSLLTVTIGAFAQFGGPRAAHFRSPDPELAMGRAEFAVEFVLGRVDATEAQQEQIKAIIQGAIYDLQPLMTEHGPAREAVQELLSQPLVDRIALEQLRTAKLQQVDTASERAVRALADAAEVLTPEQRIELIALSDRFHR